MSESIENHKLTTVIDSKNNQIIQQDKWVKNRVNQKESGYSLVYVDNLKEVIKEFSCGKGSYVLLDLLSNEVSTSFTLDIDYKKISKIYSMSESASRKFITKIKKLDVVRSIEGSNLYLVNPFLVLPKVSDSAVTEAQFNWTKEI